MKFRHLNIKISIKRGSALVYTILTIGILLNIVFFLTSVFASKLRIASSYDDSVTALYAVESGIEWQLYNQFKDPDANQPILTNGATMTFINPPGTLPIEVVGKFRGISRSFTVTFSEIVSAACNNLIDDDGDSLIDFPVDPGCASALDADEVDAPPPPPPPPPPPSGPPTATVDCNPCSGNPGDSSSIIWSSTNADTCTIAPTGWSGPFGSQSTGPLSRSVTYTATCSGPGGPPATDQVTVNITPWWDLAWSNRKTITFNNSASSADLIDFPVLVQLTPANFNYSKSKAGGADLRFVDENDYTVLNYEIETWNSGGTSNIWVKVPKINRNSATDFIYIYYNDPSASDAQSAFSVWSNAYAGVWHLPNGTTLNVNDSTGRNNGNNHAASAVSGKVDGAGRFNGSASYITTGTNGMATGNTPWTLEAWLNTNVANDQYHLGLGYGSGGTIGASPMIGIGGNGNRWQVQTWGCEQLPSNCINGSAAQTGIWTYVVGVGNGLNLSLYLNGAVNAGPTFVTSNSPTNSRSTIGGSAQASPCCLWNGNIDEVRISNTARSTDWIRASYLTENLQMNTFGGEENKP